jgi:hypothetical protein
MGEGRQADSPLGTAAITALRDGFMTSKSPGIPLGEIDRHRGEPLSNLMDGQTTQKWTTMQVRQSGAFPNKCPIPTSYRYGSTEYFATQCMYYLKDIEVADKPS